MAFTLADGQLPAVAAAIYTGATGDADRINGIFSNTSATLTETIVLTFQRLVGTTLGTARRIVRAVLAPNEQLRVIGLPMRTGDVLTGVTTDATTVDYLITRSEGTILDIGVLDANGSFKQVASSISGNQAVNGILSVGALTFAPVVPLTTNGAVPPHTAAVYAITKAGVLADTLAAPTVGGPGVGDDGVVITITSDNANAHTLTATALLDTGSANASVATFAAQKGAGLTLMAYNGRWKVLSQIGITFT
jgi:hypothetical protein